MLTFSLAKNKRVEQQVKETAMELLSCCAGSRAEVVFSIIHKDVVRIAVNIQKEKGGHPLLREDIAEAIGTALGNRLCL